MPRPSKRGPRPGRSGGYYRNKSYPAVSVTLTALAKRILQAATRRTGETASNVVEQLLRDHGAGVQFPKPGA